MFPPLAGDAPGKASLRDQGHSRNIAYIRGGRRRVDDTGKARALNLRGGTGGFNLSSLGGVSHPLWADYTMWGGGSSCGRSCECMLVSFQRKEDRWERGLDMVKTALGGPNTVARRKKLPCEIGKPCNVKREPTWSGREKGKDLPGDYREDGGGGVELTGEKGETGDADRKSSPNVSASRKRRREKRTIITSPLKITNAMSQRE